MIEPFTLSVPELAERWSVTPRQIIEQALALRLPILFLFDGLVFDNNDRWLRGIGAWAERREVESLRTMIENRETHIRRNAAGLTGEFDRMNREEVIEERRAINDGRRRLLELETLLEKREEERAKHECSEYMRALPKTLLEIMQHGETAFPSVALHPQSTVVVADHKGTKVWDGQMVALEPGRAGQWKPRLKMDDLLIPIVAIKAIESAGTQNKEEPAKHVSKSQLQEQAMLDALRKLGYTPGALPPQTPGSSWVKAQARRGLSSRKDLFTTKTFDSTWERLRKSGEIAEQA